MGSRPRARASDGLAPSAHGPATAVHEGVFVVGAGRGGTSAVTRLINLLAVPLCVESDLLPPSAPNPTGYWESTTVMAMDEILLNLGGGRWSCPPSPETVTELASPRMGAISAEAFRRLHPTPQWVVKDPRLTITMPYWMGVLDVAPLVVIAFREPGEVARSARVFGVDEPDAYALWERYMRTALRLAAGRPAVVVELRDVLARPRQWCEETAGFLAGHGFTVRADWAADVEEFLRPEMLRTEGAGAMPDTHHEILELLRALAGHHDALTEVVLPDESPATSTTIAARHTELAPREGRQFPTDGRGVVEEFWSEASRVWDEMCVAAGSSVDR